jgi:hypothetical protein
VTNELATLLPELYVLIDPELLIRVVAARVRL